METVSYDEGYRKALIDIHKWMTIAEFGLKDARINNTKGVLGCLSCILDNQDTFMQEQEDFAVYFIKEGKKIKYSTTPPDNL